MTFKNGFGKCSLIVLSANGRKDQLWPLRFPAKENLDMEEGVVRLDNKRRQSEVSIDF